MSIDAGVRFLVVLIIAACVCSLCARLMLDDMGPTTGAVVWLAALALALTDAVFRRREAAGR